MGLFQLYEKPVVAMGNQTNRMVPFTSNVPLQKLADLQKYSLMMTSGQVVETSVNVTSNRPFQEYTHPYIESFPFDPF